MRRWRLLLGGARSASAPKLGAFVSQPCSDSFGGIALPGTWDMKTARKISWDKVLLAVSFPVLLIGLVGCSTYADDTARMMAAWNRGDYAAAAATARAEAEDSGSTDRLVWQLEWGATTRGAGQFEESRKAFDSVLASLAEWDMKPDISLSSEALSVINNMSSFPYRGTAYDRIMASTYQALNYLTLGDPDKARVSLNQALDRQAEAVRAQARRIEKAQAEARSARNASESYDVDRAMSNGRFRSSLGGTYAEMRRMKAYADYVNPFSVWLHGVFFMTNATSGSELERGYKSLERVAGMAGSCAAVQADFALAKKMRDEGAAVPSLTYVIFETGRAPSRREVRIDIPLFVVSNTIPYVGAAFPALQFNGNYASTLTISATGAAQPVRTQTVASMDSVIATDFDNQLTEIITRTLINTGVKATVSYLINHEAKKHFDRNQDDVGAALIYIGSLVATSVYSASTTRADLRTWLTLPKEFQVARLTTPPDRRLHLAAGQSPAVDVELISGSVNVVYVKSTGVGTPLTVSQFVLKP